MKIYQQKFFDLINTYQAISYGDFIFKSGRRGTYFYNAGAFQDGASLVTLGECYAEAILDHALQFDQLFGPAYKGIPLVVSVAIALAQKGVNKPFSFNRKEAKDHGEGGMIVGAPLKGRVLVIDDVITAGTAFYHSVHFIQQAQAELAGLVIGFDRQEPGRHDETIATAEIARDFNIPVISLVTAEQLHEDQPKR